MLQIKHIEDELERESAFQKLIKEFIANQNITPISDLSTFTLIKTVEQIKRYENKKKDFEIERENNKMNEENLKRIKSLKQEGDSKTVSKIMKKGGLKNKQKTIKFPKKDAIKKLNYDKTSIKKKNKKRDRK